MKHFFNSIKTGQIFGFLKPIFIWLISFKLRFSLLLIHYIIGNPYLYALYLCLCVFTIFFSTAMLEGGYFCQSIYYLSVSFYAEIQESAIDVCLIYWVPQFQKRVEHFVGTSFLKKTIGTISIKKMVFLIFLPFGVFYSLLIGDILYRREMILRDLKDYALTGDPTDLDTCTKKIDEIILRKYSFMKDIRDAIARFIKQL